MLFFGSARRRFAGLARLVQYDRPMRLGHRIAVIVCLVMSWLPVRESDAAVHLEPVLAGLSSPVFVTSARDGSGRLFVVEQAGLVKVAASGSATPTVFLDIRSKVPSTGGEQGLLGLAFHPQYSSNRRFFVAYTRKGDGAIVVAEYRASPANANVADTAETPILTVAHPFTNHNGGMIAFGPDGFLYIGMGDGGGANDPGDRAQNLDELLGKILRIDVDHPNGSVPYSSPASNPFVGSAGRDEIFAYGLRNPWRFSFDRATGDLYVGDVGQGAREEVDVVVSGGNYGWRIREGFVCTTNDPDHCDDAGLLPPILDYKHNNGRCSITGGYVYRGALGTLPAGTYVYADYCTGEIFQFAGGVKSPLLDAGFFLPSFGEDEAGEIYVVDHGGAIHRLSGDAAPCSYALEPTGNSVSAAARAATAAVTTGPACAWSATSHVSWITVTPGAGTGSGTVRYSVAANSGPARIGTLTIGGQTLTVSQAASPLSCRPTIAPPIAFTSSGASGSISVSIDAGCTWTAVSNSPWITVTGGGGPGSGVVTYSIAPGRGFRTGSITIAGRVVTVLSF